MIIEYLNGEKLPSNKKLPDDILITPQPEDLTTLQTLKGFELFNGLLAMCTFAKEWRGDTDRLTSIAVSCIQHVLSVHPEWLTQLLSTWDPKMQSEFRKIIDQA